MEKKVISSVLGRIKKIVIVYENNDASFNLLIQLYKSLSKGVQIIIILRNGELKSLESKLNTNASIKLHDLSIINQQQPNQTTCYYLLKECIDVMNNSIWVRDQYIVLTKNQHLPSLLEPNNGFQSDVSENLIKKGIAEGYGNTVLQQSFKIAGGNILVGRKHVLIGYNEFRNMVKGNMISPESINDAKKEIRKTLGFDQNYNIIIIGLTKSLQHQIISKASTSLIESSVFNISTWFSKQQIPKGVALAKRKTQDDEQIISDYDLRVHIDMFITLTGESCNNLPIVLVGQLIPTRVPHIKTVKVLEKKLDEIVQQLCKEGFFVLRNPIPLINRKGFLYYGLYNNCLVENTLEEKNVWLPCFTSNLLDRKNKFIAYYEQRNQLIWESLGFTVHMIKTHFHEYSKNGGALHCLTNELERTII